ncbi:MAG: hypothetical protein ACK5LL_07705 [Suipraeoptans sp.]
MKVLFGVLTAVATVAVVASTVIVTVKQVECAEAITKELIQRREINECIL